MNINLRDVICTSRVSKHHYTVQAHLSAGQHACVCLLSGWAKNDFFLPAAVTRCTVMFNVKFDKFQLKTELWDFSPQNCQNMHFCQKKCAPGVNRLHEFYEIFSIYRQTTELWAFLMEEFSHKFAVVPRAKLLIRSEKLGGARAKIGQTKVLYHCNKFCGIVWCTVVVDKTVWCVFCLLVTLQLTEFFFAIFSHPSLVWNPCKGVSLGPRVWKFVSKN